MQLSSIEYDAIMQAINNAKACIADDEFIDPYSEFADLYTNEQLTEALNNVEDKIIRANTPT